MGERRSILERRDDSLQLRRCARGHRGNVARCRRYGALFRSYSSRPRRISNARRRTINRDAFTGFACFQRQRLAVCGYNGFDFSKIGENGLFCIGKRYHRSGQRSQLCQGRVFWPRLLQLGVFRLGFFQDEECPGRRLATASRNHNIRHRVVGMLQRGVDASSRSSTASDST